MKKSSPPKPKCANRGNSLVKALLIAILLLGFTERSNAYSVFNSTLTTYDIVITYGGGTTMTVTCPPGLTTISVTSIASIRVYCQGQAFNGAALLAADGCTGRVAVACLGGGGFCTPCVRVNFSHCISGLSLPNGTNCVPPYGCDTGWCEIY
jgi:hypothetical protein